MNTPAHIAISLGLLGRGRAAWVLWPIVLGSVAPDLPMLLFYASEKLRGIPDALIWSEHYFLPQWQLFFDLPNSLPIAALGGAIAFWRKHLAWGLFFAAMALHIATDLPLHHDDAHRHFLPLSDWKFHSPVSYWDPRHYGSYVVRIELLLSLLSLILCWRRWSTLWARLWIGFLATSYVAYGIFVAIMWT